MLEINRNISVADSLTGVRFTNVVTKRFMNSRAINARFGVENIKGVVHIFYKGFPSSVQICFQALVKNAFMFPSLIILIKIY